MESSCFLTKRGRRAVSLIGAGACWVGMAVLLVTAFVTGSDDAGRVGLASSAVAAAWTVCLAVARHSDLVRQAFAAGRETGRAEVLQLHQ